MFSTIPFIEARFFSASEGRIELATRFKKHLRKLRCKRLPPEFLAPPDEIDAACDRPDIDPMDIIGISADDAARIQRRVKRIIERRKAASGLEHLKSDDRARLEVLKDGVRLISLRNEHHADELAAALHEDMPWMAPATEVVWHAARRSWREGAPGLRIPPLQLTGPPGIGKSYFARRLGALLSTTTTVIEATGENASFGIVGSQRGWGGSHPGRLIETVLQSRIANPVMVVDEIEKAGQTSSMKGHAPRKRTSRMRRFCRTGSR
ncbi:AAA family ATPase [Paracoccus versutus]|uniref:AAA family ATPase n=1 Tax=Paracoccus versutus TaxID=34007 RepID=UPI000DF76C2C|nr:AAA family ATPase [Paracoccus versutus]RDD71241.1 AAA family ATPase [Paracoccus versutus]